MELLSEIKNLKSAEGTKRVFALEIIKELLGRNNNITQKNCTGIRVAVSRAQLADQSGRPLLIQYGRTSLPAQIEIR